MSGGALPGRDGVGVTGVTAPGDRRGLGAALDRLSRALGPSVTRDAPLGALTTYRVGGPAALSVVVESEEDLDRVRRALLAAGAPGVVPVLVLGKGSNLLVADDGFGGLVVRLGSAFATVEVVDDGRGPAAPVVRAGGAAGLPVVARRSVEAGLAGLEWMVGIPGSVGGALRMNAGGHGSDTARCLRRYRVFDLAGGGAAVESGPETLRLGYRTSALGPTEVVVWAELAARRGDPDAGRAAVSAVVRWRRANQPGGSNAGSVFTNPAGDSAGRLVESVGLKGHRLGTARVSERHANFIQADEGGSADDVARLIAHVRDRVVSGAGVLLRPEVQLVGFPPDVLAEPAPGAGR